MSDNLKGNYYKTFYTLCDDAIYYLCCSISNSFNNDEDLKKSDVVDLIKSLKCWLVLNK